MIDVEVIFIVKGCDYFWVLCGGVKLVYGFDYFGWDIVGVVVIDVGSLIGGFIDVMLSKGVVCVYVVDSGIN